MRPASGRAIDPPRALPTVGHRPAKPPINGPLVDGPAPFGGSDPFLTQGLSKASRFSTPANSLLGIRGSLGNLEAIRGPFHFQEGGRTGNYA